MTVAIALVLGLALGLALAAVAYVALLRGSMQQERRALEQDKERAQAEGEAKAAQALLQAREESLRVRESAEADIRSQRAELDAQQQRLLEREQALLDRERQTAEREASIRLIEKEAEELQDRASQELFRVARLTEEAAREELMLRVEQEAHDAAAKRAAEIEREAIDASEQRARQVVLNSIQRLAVEYTTESTTAVVPLPSEDIKGRIIGREGRNIRTFEQVTGVDLIIDESPEVVVVSSFDPVRRETARLTLMNLMLDGRIHPGRIEELHEKASQEIERTLREAGEKAAERAGVSGLPQSVVDALGRLRFRASYAQNVLDHSVEVAELCRLLAEELGFNGEVARRAGLLHDIGKGLGPEWEGPHALAGMNFLKEKGEKDSVTLAVGAHHHEIEPSTPEAQIVIVADSISASRPGARRESLDQHLKRLAKLEEIANSFPGVDRSYAVQAGREIRLTVRPEVIDDKGASKLAADVAKRIESDLDFPGQIKVTVIRETRAHHIAK